jgi:alpha-D-ribose 1-methylphosphonate 5-triphosphate synthase subunit PhnH
METALDGGFADAPRESAHAFRAALDVMARPGRIAQVAGARPPAPLSVAAGTLILTLCDPGTPVHLAGRHDTPEVRGWIAFHTGAPVTGRAEAAFALGTWEALLPLDGYRIGAVDYPDRSATLIVEIAALAPDGTRLTGPGIRDAARLSLPETEAFRRNARAFPLGLDFFLTAGDRVAALPRTTRVG